PRLPSSLASSGATSSLPGGDISPPDGSTSASRSANYPPPPRSATPMVGSSSGWRRLSADSGVPAVRGTPPRSRPSRGLWLSRVLASGTATETLGQPPTPSLRSPSPRASTPTSRPPARTETHACSRWCTSWTFSRLRRRRRRSIGRKGVDAS
ncbi:unnamed protein product, partial [Ectocarpus fasciculatus]